MHRYKVQIVPGPLWEVTTANCETIVVPAADVPPDPGPFDFAPMVEADRAAHGAVIHFNQASGCAARVVYADGEPLTPLLGPYADKETAWRRAVEEADVDAAQVEPLNYVVPDFA